MGLHFFGVRHHGPGCARSLAQALRQLQPDAILIEGPPEADSLLPLAAHQDMRPPVALLVYAPAMPQHASHFPFAEFSPEWQAILYGQQHGVPTRFIDLPMAHTLAAQMSLEGEQEAPGVEEGATARSGDAMAQLAQAAGFSDTETWWDHLVEQRSDSLELFAAIQEMMTAARQSLDEPLARREAQREAYMRLAIRAAQKEGHERIAVVCGAWHVPALCAMPSARHDKDLLGDLPKAKVAATWTPWTYGRLSFNSGYGAGVQAPGWYHHLWQTPQRAAVYWLTDAARLLRRNGLDASSAHVIEALRLADGLAALRDRSRAGLGELLEALQSVLFGDSDRPLRLIEKELLVNERLGTVPAETPTLPLPADVRQLQKSYRMAPRADQQDLELDLRQPRHLEKSIFLHRLALLGIDWGRARTVTGKSGSFHEKWVLAWEPDFEVQLIEANVWGATVESACHAKLVQLARQSSRLAEVTGLAEKMLLADARLAVPEVMERMQELAASTHEAGALLEALAPLANVLRYGSTRATDTASVAQVMDGLVQRACIALPLAARGINEEAAQVLLRQLQQADQAIGMLQRAEHVEAWLAALEQCTRGQAHPLLAGRAVRILLERTHWQVAQVAQALSLACTNPVEPIASAEWLEGFLQGSGLLLVMNEQLWQILQAWVGSLPGDTFVALLPLLRRTFASFEAAERRQLGQRVATGSVALAPPAAGAGTDERRAALVLPVLAALLGAAETNEEMA